MCEKNPVTLQVNGLVYIVIVCVSRTVFRSGVIRGKATAKYKISVAGVKQIELIVDPAGDGNNNDWGLWLDPVLAR